MFLYDAQVEWNDNRLIYDHDQWILNMYTNSRQNNTNCQLHKTVLKEILAFVTFFIKCLANMIIIYWINWMNISWNE